MAGRFPSRAKAGKILSDKEVRGKPLTEKQRGLFGLIASGKRPTKLRDRARRTALARKR